MSPIFSFKEFGEHLREFIRGCNEPTANVTAFGPALGSEFNRLALELFGLQFKNNVPYRKLCERRGMTPANVASWQEIPAAPASAFKEFEFSCLGARERTAVFHSSGTGEHRPSRHWHHAESLAIYEASLWPWFQKHLLPEWTDCNPTGRSQPPVPRLITLMPNPTQAPHSSLVYMCETIRRQLAAVDTIFLGGVSEDGAWTLDIGGAIEALQEAIQLERPVLLLGTAFLFVHLLDSLEARALRIRLPPGSRVMETGGYKGRSRSLSKAELHEWMASILGVPENRVISEYGMSELSSQAYDGVAGEHGAHALLARSGQRAAIGVPSSRAPGTFQFPPWAGALVISPESGREVSDGETGLLRIFDLANVYSVLAIQTEDLAIRRGNRFELLGRAALAEPRGCSLMACEVSKEHLDEPA